MSFRRFRKQNTGVGLTGHRGFGANRLGYALLPPTLSLTSGSYLADGRFEGTDASAAGWPAKIGGVTLALGSTGTDPTYNQSTPFGAPQAVLFNNGKSFIAPNNSFLNITDDSGDVAFECLFRYVAKGAENAIAGKFAAGAQGMLFVNSAGNGANLYRLCNLTVGAGSFVAGSTYYIIVFGDRNGNTRIYRQGTVSVTGVTAAVTLNVATPFCIGSYNSGGSSKSVDAISFYQQWNMPAGAIGSVAEQDAVAAARFAMTGL